MKCLFLSDAHYPFSDEIINFLLDTYLEFDAIYILGDLFEFYYGYDSFVYPHHLQLINTLRFISKKVKVTLFEGNHEYRLERISDFLDVRVVKGALVEKIGKYTVFMSHGDTIDRLDLGYRLFRATLKNKLMLSFINTIPPSNLLKLSQIASKVSKENLKSKRYRGTEKTLERYAKDLLEEEVDVVIFGHVHKPVFKELENGLYINTGEFYSIFSYVTFDSEDFKMHYWRGGNDKGRGKEENR